MPLSVESTIASKNFVTRNPVCILYSIFRGEDLVADIYETTPIMSTYILAFVVGDFGHSELQARPGLTVTIYYFSFYAFC